MRRFAEQVKLTDSLCGRVQAAAKTDRQGAIGAKPCLSYCYVVDMMCDQPADLFGSTGAHSSLV